MRRRPFLPTLGAAILAASSAAAQTVDIVEQSIAVDLRDETAMTVELELFVRGGRVAGTLRTVAAGDRSIDGVAEPLVLIRCFEDGTLRWGVKNGKRPRAIVATRVRLIGTDRLEGEQEMLGVVLPPRLRQQVRPTPVQLERQPEK